MASHPKDDGYLKVILPKRVALFESIQAKQLSQLRAVAGDPINITLPDGSVKEGRKWETSPFDVAKELSESLAANALIAQVNGGLWDMTRPLEGDCNLKIFTFDSDEGRDTFWHSSGHILGQSLEMEYGCKLCIGPCTTRGEGFYYDAFYGDLGLNEGHFKQIEAAASRVVAEKQPFERIEVSRDQALDMFSENPFKVEIINDLPVDETITVYRCGPLVDLCQGPHIPNTSFVKSFAILKATSVYWRGNEDRESLLRVCGISYPDQNKLEMTSISTSASSSQTINPPDSTLSSSSSTTFFLPPPPPPLSSSTPIFHLQPQPQLQLQLQPQFTSLSFQNPNPSVPPPPPPPLPLPLPLLLPPQQQQQQLRPHSFLPVVTVPNAFLLPPPGVAAYPSAYSATIRPVFPPRPLGGMGVFPAIPRPLAPVATGIRPIFPPVVRPALVPATPAEKPQTTVYVGKIAPTVENDFMLSLLQLCGPVKNWTRPQDPSNGAPKGFGFCEFESAEGVLRALRLLSKLSIDGQELMLNVNQATREYLERYVEKKTENAKKLIGAEPAVQKEGEDSQAAPVTESNAEKNHLSNTIEGNLNNESESEKESNNNANFGVVTDLDKVADKEALQKLMLMIEERLKNKPLPPPASPAPLADVLGNGSETPAKSKDKVSGTDIDDGIQKNEEDAACDNRTSEHDRTDIRSPERNRRYDRRHKEHDRERDQHREKEKELERYEREAEREKIRKERDQRRRLEEAEREYEQRLKDWEYREREREKQRQYEKEREKERERKRRKEIIYDEENDDDDTRKRWHRSVLEERRRRRIREKEDDLADRKNEEEEIAEAKMRAEEEEKQQLQRQREALKLFSGNMSSDDVSSPLEKTTLTHLRLEDDPAREISTADGNGWQVGPPDISTLSAVAIADIHHNSNVPARKLGFGLVGSGKRTAVPSFFNEEDDDDTHKEKKLRPLVPIDYSTEEIQAVQPSFAGHSQPNLAAAAEFAKRISNANVKEDKPEYDREKNRRSHDRSSQRDKGRNDEDANRTKDDSRVKNHDRDREREQGLVMSKTADNKKLWDAKQLIDMIPRTKEDLFSYEINWALYDQYGLHERMRPWISKKIMEFLGEEETSLVDFIVTSTQEHVKAAEMLETLKSILDEEAEMFVLKMWRMLIFEIKKIETGLHLRSRS